MAMARQFFDAQKASPLGPSFLPAQMTPIQDLVSRQYPLIPTSPATPGFNNTWADVQRAPSLPQNTFSSAAWASEFGSATFVPGPVVQQTVNPMNGASTLKLNIEYKI
jgi:hypothetical protein